MMTGEQMYAQSIKANRVNEFLVRVDSMITEDATPENLSFAAQLIATCATMAEEVSDTLEQQAFPQTEASGQKMLTLLSA